MQSIFFIAFLHTHFTFCEVTSIYLIDQNAIPRVKPPGAHPGFLKGGRPNQELTELRRLWGQGMSEGDVPPSEAEKKCNFQSQFARFGAFFLPEGPTQSQVPYLCKKNRGVRATCTPSKSAPDHSMS